MKRQIKGAILSLALAASVLSTSAVTAFAGTTLKFLSSTSGSGNAIKVRNVEMDSDNDSYKNEIELNFSTKVQYRSNFKVASVKDNKGASYSAKITDRDSDECDIYIKNLKKGRTYTIKLTGIKKARTSSYRTFTVKVTVPSSKTSTASNKGLRVREVSVDMPDWDDYDKGSVSFDFNKNVSFKSNAYVIIKDSNGRQMSTKNSWLETEHDECEVQLNRKLTQGRKYTYSIVGVKVRGASSYTTINGSFYAYDD